MKTITAINSLAREDKVKHFDDGIEVLRDMVTALNSRMESLNHGKTPGQLIREYALYAMAEGTDKDEQAEAIFNSHE